MAYRELPFINPGLALLCKGFQEGSLNGEVMTYPSSLSQHFALSEKKVIMLAQATFFVCDVQCEK